MEAFFNLFTSIDPLAALITIVIGVVWAYLFRSYEFDQRTMILIGGFYVPLIVSRILYSITYGITGQGFIGFIYIAIYVVAAYGARAWFRRNERQKNKSIDELIKELDTSREDKV